MLTLTEYKQIVSELIDELPEEFFRKLSGGVVVSEDFVIPDYAKGNDLYITGHYKIYSGNQEASARDSAA